MVRFVEVKTDETAEIVVECFGNFLAEAAEELAGIFY